MIVVNSKKALELLREAVEDRGRDHTYQKPAEIGPCYYWHKDANEVGCMVGAALLKAGVTPERLIALDDHADGTGAHELTERDLGDVRVTDLAAHTLAAAQRTQDNGLPWGTALDHAYDLAARLDPVTDDI